MILCAISQSTYFAASCIGSLDRMLSGIKLSQESANYCRKMAFIYTSLAWIVHLVNSAFLCYTVLFTGGYMDMTLAPVTVYVAVSNPLAVRIVVFVLFIYLSAAWSFPHAMSFMLATIFSHRYKQLEQMFEQRLLDSSEHRVSDSEIETLRQRHEEISSSVKETDKFLMFSNAGAFCCQLFGTVLLLYALIFYNSAMTDPVVIIKRAFWILGLSFGLSVTTAGGIMVNHYVSANVYFFTVWCGDVFFSASETAIHTQTLSYNNIIMINVVIIFEMMMIIYNNSSISSSNNNTNIIQ